MEDLIWYNHPAIYIVYSMAAGNIEDFRKKTYLLIKIIYFGYSGV